MRNILLFALVAFILISCSEKNEVQIVKEPIIPQPQEIQYLEGAFELNGYANVFAQPEFDSAIEFLQNYLKHNVAWWPERTENQKEANIVIEKKETLPEEGYELNITEKKIHIKAKDAEGAFWAIQTLRQLFPSEIENLTRSDVFKFHIPCVSIKDAPAFRYRGMHLDVGRHFFDKEFIKEYISYLSLLKMNYFHWHLTEDQGWRIEILQYPNLTNHGAYRDETLIGHYNDTPQEFDGKRYGGYYTQEDIKEVVAFAQEHNVTIIPEIELPGHAQAAISSYPKLGCTGKQVPVATKWGIFENIYCPKEETFIFLKNVLTEVMELFPGEYIHIGGDEAPKTQWKNCDHCQKLIKDLGLKDEHELQSYFIKEIETFVNSKGKKIIGWDEILEGGLAPNATVMSWRGTQGAVEAAKDGHDVILSPTSHAYFDYYQADHMDEPLAIGGFLPLKKVYGFNPIPEELTQEESSYVLGAQGNVWTEYMPTEEQVEYMAFPRILAMSEIVWHGPTKNLEEDYPGFLSRVENFLPRLDRLDINYANHLYDVTGEMVKENDRVFYTLQTVLPNKQIEYSTNSEKGTKNYAAPIPITENTQIKASVVLDEISKGREHVANIRFHKGILGEVDLNVQPHKAYSAGGKEALINGISGSDSRYGDKEWLGFWGDDLEVSIRLDPPQDISALHVRFYHGPGQWIYSPTDLELWTKLEDGTSIKLPIVKRQIDKGTFHAFELGFPEGKALSLQKLILKVPNYGIIPPGNQGEGHKAWTFIDEIIIE